MYCIFDQMNAALVSTRGSNDMFVSLKMYINRDLLSVAMLQLFLKLHKQTAVSFNPSECKQHRQ